MSLRRSQSQLENSKEKDALVKEVEYARALEHSRRLTRLNLARTIEAYKELEDKKAESAKAHAKKKELEQSFQHERQTTREELKIALHQNQVFIKEAKEKDNKLNSHLKELRQEKQKNADLKHRLEEANAHVERLSEQLETANENAKKTPRWKYILGISLFVAGTLLTATGVGAAAGIPLNILGLVAFGTGATIITSEFLYGVYKAIKACISPSDVTDVPEPSSPSNDLATYEYSPAIIRRGLSIQKEGYLSDDEKPLARKRKRERENEWLDDNNPFSFSNFESNKGSSIDAHPQLNSRRF